MTGSNSDEKSNTIDNQQSTIGTKDGREVETSVQNVAGQQLDSLKWNIQPVEPMNEKSSMPPPLCPIDDYYYYVEENQKRKSSDSFSNQPFFDNRRIVETFSDIQHHSDQGRGNDIPTSDDVDVMSMSSGYNSTPTADDSIPPFLEVNLKNDLSMKRKATVLEEPTEQNSSGTEMRKKYLVNTTHQEHHNEQVEDNNTSAPTDENVQCKYCSDIVNQPIYDYVNKHPYVEISFVSMPENEWKEISSQDSTAVPEDHQVDADLSWIPAQPTRYTSPVQCNLCSYKSCTRRELVEHVMAHSLPISCQYRCKLCGLTISRFFDMLDHIASHTGEFRYLCNYCDVRFAYVSEIKSHLSIVHESQGGLCFTKSSNLICWISKKLRLV